MRNELLMKTLPGAALWIYILLCGTTLSPANLLGETEEREGGRERGRTNSLDFNKVLSQQIAKTYISYAGTLGALPARLNTALFDCGSCVGAMGPK